MKRASVHARPAAERLPLWELEDGLVVTTQGVYLVPYALTGLDSEHLPESALAQAARQLYDGLKTDLPDGAYVQLVLEGRGDYEDTFARFEGQPPSGNAVLQLQRKRRQDFLRRSGLRRHRLYAAVGSLDGLSRREFAALDRATHEARRAAAEGLGLAWVALLGRVGVRARQMAEREVEALLHQGLNAPGEAYVPTRRLDLETNRAGEVWVRSRRAQVWRSEVEWRDDACVVGGQHTRVFFLQDLPDATSFPTLTEALYHLGVDFRFTLHLQVPAQDGMQRLLRYARRIANADAHRNPNISDPERLGTLQEMNHLATNLADTRQKLVRVGAQLVVWADDAETLEARSRQVTEHLRTYGLGFAPEDGRHDWELPKSMLGMGAGFDRLKLLPSNNAGDLMPLFSACHGDRDPVLLVKTARHELFSFNPVEAGRDNWNATVFGASGAGKSVFMNMLITTAMLGGPTSGCVFVVDFAGETKSSYLMVARLFGGRFVPVVSQAGDVALNPFPPAREALDAEGKLTSETLNFLLVLTDLLLANTGDGMDAQLYRAILQRGLQAVYAGHSGDEAPTYRDLAAILQALRGHSGVDRDRLGNLLNLLEGFLESPDARFFLGEGAAPITDAPFVIFDLFGIDSLAPQIAEALTFLTCQYVKRVAFGGEGTSYVVLDEVAQLLKREGMVSLVDELYSTARKHATSVWTITQNYGAYCKSAVAETVKLNSTTQVFLSHATAADVRELVAKDFDFSGRERALLEQLETRKSQFSEVLLRTQVFDEEAGEKRSIVSKLRVELSPFDYELATSDARDRARQRKWLTQNPGVPVDRVLDALGQQRASKARRSR